MMKQVKVSSGEDINIHGGAVARIRSLYPSLSAAQQRVADYVLEHLPEVIYKSISELADECKVGEASIIRFCRSIGFVGFQEFKLVVSRDLEEPPGNLHQDISTEDSIQEIIEKITYRNKYTLDSTLKLLDIQEVDRAVDAILRARKVEFYGVGVSGFTAMDAKYKFLRIGVLCDAFTDGHLQAMSASTLTPCDVVVGISQSGSTRDIIDACTVARGVGAKVIALTGHLRSPITEVSDIKLITAVQESPLGSGALSGKIAQVHVLDIMFSGVVVRMHGKALEMTERTANAVLSKLY